MYYKDLPLSHFTSRIARQQSLNLKKILELEKDKKETRNYAIAGRSNHNDQKKKKKRGRMINADEKNNTKKSRTKKKKTKKSEKKSTVDTSRETRIMELRSWTNQFTPGMMVHLHTTFKNTTTAWFPAIVLNKFETKDGISIECRHRYANVMDTVTLNFDDDKTNKGNIRRIVKSDRVELVWTPIRYGKSGIMWWPSQIVSEEVVRGNSKIMNMRKKAEKIASKTGQPIKLVYFLGSKDWGWLPTVQSEKVPKMLQSASPNSPNPNGKDFKNKRKTWQAAMEALDVLRSIVWKRVHRASSLKRDGVGVVLKSDWIKRVDRNIEFFKCYILSSVYECEYGCGFENASQSVVEAHEAICKMRK